MLNQLKTLLGLSDESQDEKLNTIITLTEKRLASLLGVTSVPDEMGYVVVEVSVKRFNRVGSEGMTAHGVEGESISFQENDFADFMDDIDAYRRSHNNAKARIRFI